MSLEKTKVKCLEKWFAISALLLAFFTPSVISRRQLKIFLFSWINDQKQPKTAKNDQYPQKVRSFSVERILNVQNWLSFRSDRLVEIIVNPKWPLRPKRSISAKFRYSRNALRFVFKVYLISTWKTFVYFE